MTLHKVRLFVERHIHAVVATMIFSVLALWGISNFIDPLRDFLVHQSIFNLIIIFLLMDVLLRVVELKSEDRSNFQLFRDEPDGYEHLRSHLERSRPRRADLIEYSTATIHDLLERLKQADCHLRILICNPQHAVTSFQRNRIHDRVRDLITLTFRSYPSVEIRMYALPASIRGRMIDDNYVTVGWHTYSSDEAGIYGHTNPMVTTNTDSAQGQAMKTMFVNAFELLWSAPSTKVLLSPGPVVHLDVISDNAASGEILGRLEDD